MNVESQLRALNGPGQKVRGAFRPVRNRLGRAALICIACVAVVTTASRVSAATPPATDPSRSAGHLYFPAFNPDRRNWDLYVIELSTGLASLVREQASQPALNLSGTWLAFKSEDPSKLGLATLNLVTRDVHQVTGFAEDAWPRWARDVPGLMLFASQRRADRRSRLYGALSDGTAEWEFAVNNKPIYAGMPDTLPGNRMIFAGCLESRCGIFVAEGDGSDARPVTLVPTDAFPAASPDGRFAAYMSLSGQNWDLNLVDLVTGEVVPLVRSAANEGSPAWSPDGHQVAFVSDRDGSFALWAVSWQPGNPPSEPVHLLDMIGLPPDGWPWLDQRVAWLP